MVGYRVLISIVLIVALSHGYVFKSKSKNFRRRPKPNISDPADSTLVLSHVIFRHGNRTPELSELYPLDPHLNYSYYPLTHGQLTKAGKQKEYSIGTALRERYDAFLGQYYVPDLVDARSTDRNRTKMSLMLVLASLFPPRNSEIWQPGLNWQPVPYNYVPERHDDVLYGISCPHYLKLYKEIQTSPEVLTEYEEYRENFTYIAENTGLNVTIIQNVYDLYFGLSTEEEYGLKLPEWTKRVWPDIINEISFKQYGIYTKTTEMKQMAVGYLIQKIIDDSERRINNLNNNTKIYLYSGHENNLGQLFVTLDLFQYPHIPTYGSYVLFEVHYINGTYGFKIYYQNYDTSSATPRLLRLPACDEFCPLDEFKSLVQEYLPPDGLCKSQQFSLFNSRILSQYHYVVPFLIYMGMTASFIADLRKNRTKAMKDATQWHKASNQSKRNPRHEVTGDSPKDADVENLNRNVKDLSNEGAEVQTELNSVNQSECQILKPSCMLSELLEVAGKKTFDLMKNLDDLCSRHYHLLKVCDKMKKELEKLTVVKAGQRNEILQLRKLAKQQKREKNILAHQNNLLLQGLKQDNSTDALTLLQEIENLKRIIEDERAKYEKGLKRLQERLEGEENDSRAGALEERLKLVQRELQEALARAEAAEQKFKAPPLPPPPPPLMAAGESPVVPFRRRRSRATGEDPAKIRVQKFISQKKAAPGVNEDIINAIKERKFTLKKLKREGMVDSKENDKEAPKAVSELRNILGSLRKAPKKRQSQFRGDGQ